MTRSTNSSARLFVSKYEKRQNPRHASAWLNDAKDILRDYDEHKHAESWADIYSRLSRVLLSAIHQVQVYWTAEAHSEFPTTLTYPINNVALAKVHYEANLGLVKFYSNHSLAIERAKGAQANINTLCHWMLLENFILELEHLVQDSVFH